MSFNIVEIIKIKSNNCHFYSVSYPFEAVLFYISIDPNKKTIEYYNDNKFVNVMGIIDFNFDEAIRPINGLDEFAVYKSAIQGYKAIQKKDFPNELTWSP